MKEIKFVCDICGERWELRESVGGEVTITTPDRFVQFQEVCQPCIVDILARIQKLKNIKHEKGN